MFVFKKKITYHYRVFYASIITWNLELEFCFKYIRTSLGRISSHNSSLVVLHYAKSTALLLLSRYWVYVHLKCRKYAATVPQVNYGSLFSVNDSNPAIKCRKYAATVPQVNCCSLFSVNDSNPAIKCRKYAASATIPQVNCCSLFSVNDSNPSNPAI